MTSRVVPLTLDGITSFLRMRYVVKTSDLKGLAGVFLTMSITRENLKESNEFCFLVAVC